jgi:hypothetical protein
MLNKKAQISEIMTWVVATLVILSILIIFIYASSLLAQKTKVIKAKDLKIDLGKEVDWIETKNSITYGFASQSERNIIESWEEQNDNEE